MPRVNREHSRSKGTSRPLLCFGLIVGRQPDRHLEAVVVDGAI